MSGEKKPERIHDVDIDRDALKNITSLEQLKKTEIFSHLDANQQESGYAKLFAELKPAAPAAGVSSAPAAVKPV